MNEDHEARLEALGEKLCNVFLVEADPDVWPGAAKPPNEQTKDERGDRAWTLKAANQVGLLFARALELRQRVKWARLAAAGQEVPPAADAYGLGHAADPEADIKRFEAEAQRVMEKLGARGAR